MTKLNVTGGRVKWRSLFLLSLAFLLAMSTATQSLSAVAVKQGKKPAKRNAKRQDATKHKINGQKQKSIEGVLVQTESGVTLRATNADVLFNPASTLKLATTFMALHELGPEFKFATTVFKGGAVKNGELSGNLYVQSDDLIFSTSGATDLARELNSQGIRSVSGKLVVSSGFHMNVVTGGKAAATALAHALNPPAIKGQATLLAVPRVRIRGGVAIGVAPPQSVRVASHQSIPLKEILKAMLCFSNNHVADNLGNYLAKRSVPAQGQHPPPSGARALQNFLITQLDLEEDEVHLSSTSGLYKNRLTPLAEMKVLRALKKILASNPLAPHEHLTLSDVLPVAGVDPGTLRKRFQDEPGTVIAKTGTLPDTDAGVTTLVGQADTRDGDLLFVIFEQGVGRGSIAQFRQRQEQIVDQLQNQHGGARDFGYDGPVVYRLGR